MKLFRFVRASRQSDADCREVLKDVATDVQLKPAASHIATAASAPAPGRISAAKTEMKVGKPYLALIGQIFDVWGIVEVLGDSRAHVGVKDLPAEILNKIGVSVAPEIVAIERKLVLAHTKGFHDLPRSVAHSLLDDLRETLIVQADEFNERVDGEIKDRELSDPRDLKWLKQDIKEIEAEFKSYWRDELRGFREHVLPEARTEFWDSRIDDLEAELEGAKSARQQSLERRKGETQK